MGAADYYPELKQAGSINGEKLVRQVRTLLRRPCNGAYCTYCGHSTG